MARRSDSPALANVLLRRSPRRLSAIQKCQQQQQQKQPHKQYQEYSPSDKDASRLSDWDYASPVLASSSSTGSRSSYCAPTAGNRVRRRIDHDEDDSSPPRVVRFLDDHDEDGGHEEDELLLTEEHLLLDDDHDGHTTDDYERPLQFARVHTASGSEYVVAYEGDEDEEDEEEPTPPVEYGDEDGQRRDGRSIDELFVETVDYVVVLEDEHHVAAVTNQELTRDSQRALSPPLPSPLCAEDGDHSSQGVSNFAARPRRSSRRRRRQSSARYQDNSTSTVVKKRRAVASDAGEIGEEDDTSSSSSVVAEKQQPGFVADQEEDYEDAVNEKIAAALDAEAERQEEDGEEQEDDEELEDEDDDDDDVEYEEAAEMGGECSEDEDSDSEDDERSTRRRGLSWWTEMVRARFPAVSLRIRLVDYFSLTRKDEPLSDLLVDFYLNHIVAHELPEERESERVTVLPATFWHNIGIRQCARPDDFEEWTDEERKDHLYKDVHAFFGNHFELIDNDYLVVPINEWEHWQLAIVYRPFSAQGGRIVIFDSQPHHDPEDFRKIASTLQDFLMYAYERSTGKRWTGRDMSWLVPTGLVQESNSADCGLFALEYARRFLSDPPAKIASDEGWRFDFTDAYPDFSVDGRREQIQQTILSLCANRAFWTPVVRAIEARVEARRRAEENAEMVEEKMEDEEEVMKNEQEQRKSVGRMRDDAAAGH